MASCRLHVPLPPLSVSAMFVPLVLLFVILEATRPATASPVSIATDSARHSNALDHYHLTDEDRQAIYNALDQYSDVDRQGLYKAFESYISYPPQSSVSTSYGPPNSYSVSNSYSPSNGYSSSHGHSSSYSQPSSYGQSSSYTPVNSYSYTSSYSPAGSSGHAGQSAAWAGWAAAVAGYLDSYPAGYSSGSSRHVLKPEHKPRCDCAPFDVLALLSGGTALCALGIFCILQAAGGFSISTGNNVSVSTRQLLENWQIPDDWQLPDIPDISDNWWRTDNGQRTDRGQLTDSFQSSASGRVPERWQLPESLQMPDRGQPFSPFEWVRRQLPSRLEWMRRQLPSGLEFVRRQLPGWLLPVVGRLTEQLQQLARQLPEHQLADRVTEVTCSVAGQLETEDLGRSGKCRCYSGLLGALTGFAALGGLIVYALQLASAAYSVTIGVGRSQAMDSLEELTSQFTDSLEDLESGGVLTDLLRLVGENGFSMLLNPSSGAASSSTGDKDGQQQPWVETGDGRTAARHPSDMLSDLPCVPYRLCDINRQAAGFGPTRHTVTRLASLPVSWLLSRSGHQELSFGRLCSALQGSKEDVCLRRYPHCDVRAAPPV